MSTQTPSTRPSYGREAFWSAVVLITITLAFLVALTISGEFTHPNTAAHARTERECDTDFDIGSQKYVASGYIVYESRSTPRTYAVAELRGDHWPAREFCNVGKRFWEDPDAWPFTGDDF